ncbi:MAG: 4-alpha-glucanotransferase, partial [Actinomycetota bacterium]|nr:4-alpha-glucanotransferase [Actinomycetota bacterium]
ETDRACTAALERLHAEREARILPPYLVIRSGESHAVAAGAELVLEDGTRRRLASEALPSDLPTGYHWLTTGDERCRLIVTPKTLSPPDRLTRGPAWGLTTQLYSARSAHSWGTGDLGDLTALATWSSRAHGADFVLVNPLHAAEVVAPMNPSPYLPTTRRFANPLYLRVEDIPEYEQLDPDGQREIDDLATDVRRASSAEDLLDRDAAWTAKREALERLHRVPRTRERQAAYAEFSEREGATLRDFATWCAITEEHGSDWRTWPEPLRKPRTEPVHLFAAKHEERVDFWAWLQWLVDEQLSAAQADAKKAGMGLGIVHDVAVGVSPAGADSWAWQGELANSVTVGAPPDAYSQTGQNWEQPPWRPDRLAELGYEPFRELFASVLRHCGGLRVDHIIGLFRLWWIPRGVGALNGTYVHYDHDALIGILALEAERVDAVLIGEDLGNVESWVRGYLRERGIFGTSILWFESENDVPLPPERWRELCLASVTTHDLPPTTGYLAGDHVRLRHQLGLLTRSFDEELAHDRADQRAWLNVLRDKGLLERHDDDPAHVVLALHRLLTTAPSLLRCAALTDLVGDRRTQNQPGTTQAQYPNWRLPLSNADGPIRLEDVFSDPRTATLAEAMRTPPTATGTRRVPDSLTG